MDRARPGAEKRETIKRSSSRSEQYRRLLDQYNPQLAHVRPAPPTPLTDDEYNEIRKDYFRAQFFRSPPDRVNPPAPSATASEASEVASGTLSSSSSHNMSFQNYVDQPPSGVGANPRQAPPSPSQNAPHPNGINSGVLAGMVGYPTPAGHQSDLNHIMATIEELSKLNAHNQLLSIGVVEKMGRIREKAKNLDLDNDGLLKLAAADLNDSTQNLERENKELRVQLEKAVHDKKENYKLACQGANILADILEKMHIFKEKHETDTLTWHRNYRNQLAYEREENLRLRNEINDKIAAAVRANGHLRDMRRYLTDHDVAHELRIQAHQYRTSCRFFRRMAMPLIPDDDSEWSDDDDLIDPEEKKKQAAEKAEKEAKPEGEEGA